LKARVQLPDIVQKAENCETRRKDFSQRSGRRLFKPRAQGWSCGQRLETGRNIGAVMRQMMLPIITALSPGSNNNRS
jgi:hypothetical protein